MARQAKTLFISSDGREQGNRERNGRKSHSGGGEVTVNLDSTVKGALSAEPTLGGIGIYQPDPPINFEMPSSAIVFEEISNVPAINADNAEQVSKITYQIDVYNDGSTAALVDAVEKAMLGIGFMRYSSRNVSGDANGLKHREILFITTREVL